MDLSSQKHARSRLYAVGRTYDLRGRSQFVEVHWRLAVGVDHAPPAGHSKGWRRQVEVERLPVGVTDHVDGLARAGHQECQGMRGVTLVRLVELDPVPFDARQLQQLEQAEAANFLEDVQMQAEMDEALHKAMDIGVLRQARPVEPTDVVVLAIGIVVAPLRAPHLVAHQEHGHADRQAA